MSARSFQNPRGTVNMQRLLKTCAVVLAVALAGCNNGKRYGRIIGFVINGQTGQRLNAFPNSGNLANLGNDSAATNQVFALVEGRFKRAEPCGQGDANQNNLITADGCYRIEGVPVNTDVPVFAQFDGFDRFHGQTRIDTVASVQEDLIDTDPQVIGNIMVWPRGFQVDYSVNVRASGRPVPDATVNCQANVGNNVFSTDGDDFINPEATTSETIRATTGADGVALLSGAQLVNGASYNCEVFRSDELAGRVVQSDFSFTAGVDEPSIGVDLNVSGPGAVLYAVRTNNENSDALLGVSATLIVYLNTPAEIVPGTVDCQRATLSTSDFDADGQTASLATDTVDNGASETTNASLSADGLVLTVALRALSTPFDTGDLGTSATFNGIFLRTRDQAFHQRSFVIGGTNPNASNSCDIGTAFSTNSLRNDFTGSNVENTLNFF